MGAARAPGLQYLRPHRGHRFDQPCRAACRRACDDWHTAAQLQPAGGGTRCRERPAPDARGETGELCISGPGVAAGYLGRPRAHGGKFLPNPWVLGDNDARLYRTGDLARIDAIGRVRCLGRADDQVKIRGFRVELGEIEAVLSQQPGVGTCAVLLQRRRHRPVGKRTWRQSLSRHLHPRHCARRFLRYPPTWCRAVSGLPQMPRPTSGKIDRKALRAIPVALLARRGSDIPQSEAEHACLRHWAAFHWPACGAMRDFFADLGGHSLH